MYLLITKKKDDNRHFIRNSQHVWSIACLAIPFLFLLPFKCFSQNYPFTIEGIFRKNRVSMPEQAALARNISYPVDHVTGSVNIKIPLYEIQCGSLTLPFYLSYNTGGIKVSEPSGWVGQGWTLYGVPVISRSPQGNTDRVLECPVETNPSNVYFKAYQVITSDEMDEEPDEYYYQLADKGGMFLYSQESEVSGAHFLSLPYEDVRIDTLHRHFLLTDDNGVRYYFNGGTETMVPSDGGRENCWRASYMVSPDGLDSVWFEYGNLTRNFIEHHEDHITVVDCFENESNRYATHSVYDFPEVFVLDEEEGLCSPIVYTTLDNATHSWQVSPQGNFYSDNRSVSYIDFHNNIIIDSDQIRLIHFNGGTMEFSVDASCLAKPLTKITIKDTQGNVIKSISFNYLYARSRFYLTELKMEDSNGHSVETYTFQYNQVYNFPEPGGRCIDFWGYYNGFGRNDAETLVPRMNVPVVTNQMDGSCYHGPTLHIGTTVPRYANEDYMKLGSLKSITYPTGSTDEFTYEANRIRLDYVDDADNPEIHFTQQLKGENGIYQVGGLRIRQIKTSHNENYVNCRTFTYGANEDGIGHSPMFENGKYFIREQTKYYIYAASSEYTNTARYRVFSSSPVTPMTYNKGAAVMYDTVTEYNGTPEENSGKTVYQYSVPSYMQYADPSLPIHHASIKYSDWQSGHLKSKIYYRYIANGTSHYEPVRKVVYNYDTMSKFLGNIRVCYYLLTSTSNNPQLALQHMGFAYFRLPVSFPVRAKLPSSETETRYFDQHVMETATSYSYGNPLELTMTSKSVTRGNVIQTEEYTHPYQLRNTAPYSNMYSKNILAPVIETTYTRGNRYLKVSTPYIEQASDQHTFYRPSSLWLQYSTNGTSEQRLSYSYDNRGNLVQTVKDNRETETYLYSYNSQYPVAEIQNAEYSTVCQHLGSAFVNNLTSAAVMSDSQWSTLNNLRTLLPNAFVTTYRMKPLIGVQSIIDPAGHENFFDYDNFGRLMSKGIIHNNSRELLEKYTYHYKTEEP